MFLPQGFISKTNSPCDAALASIGLYFVTSSARTSARPSHCQATYTLRVDCRCCKPPRGARVCTITASSIVHHSYVKSVAGLERGQRVAHVRGTRERSPGVSGEEASNAAHANGLMSWITSLRFPPHLRIIVRESSSRTLHPFSRHRTTQHPNPCSPVPTIID